MKKFPFSFLLSFALIQTLSANEELMLKRISEFWKDEAFDQAKTQILHFLEKYPGSNYCDHLYAMLGDLSIQEKAYENALKAYDHIINQELQNKVIDNYLQALFELGDFQSLLKKADKKSNDPKVNFLAGEACFRLGRQAKDPETQKTLYIQAASHLNKLSASAYAPDSLWTLAEIYKTLEEGPKAVKLYLELAEKNLEQKETLLFQAAYLQSDFDKKQAKDTFHRIYKLKGKNYKNATYNYLSLLFELGEHKTFLDSYNSMQQDIPHDKQSTLRYCASKCYFELGDYEKSADLASICESKQGILLLAANAEKLKNTKLLEKATQQLSQKFPQDIESAKAHLISAQIHIDQGDTLQAQYDLEYVLKYFPEYPEREKLMCDYAILLSKNTLWEESRKAFHQFLEAYPKSRLKNQALRHLLNIALKEGKREVFTETLGKALESPDGFTEEEKQNYHLLLIKLLSEQGNRPEASVKLADFLETYPNSVEGQFFASAFYEDDVERFKTHAERVLALDPYLPDSEYLHLKLYNIYIQMPGKQDLAADHLYACAATSAVQLKNENIQWLAIHYFNKKQDSSARNKALFLFEKIACNDFSPSIEKDLLKYSELLQMEGKYKENIELLKKLSQNQQENNQLPWKFQRQTLFELAKSYADAHDYEKAIQAYDLLITTSTHMPSFFSRAATLERARLQYALLTPEEKQENNPQMEIILSSLKDLQLKKKLYSEPLHLEAALDYVMFMSHMTPDEKRNERTLFLLKRVKENFSSRNSDIISKEYHSQRSALPDKTAILEAYLCFIDAEILRLEGKIKRAEKLYKKLQQKTLDPALQKRVNTSMETFYDAH